MNSQADVWAKILSLLEKEMTSTAVTTWFDDAVAVDLTDDTLVLYTPVPFKHDVISRTYLPALKKALFELFAKDFEVRLLTGDELEAYRRERPAPPAGQDIGHYTFDRFVVGNSNKFAHAAARAVADNPAKSYNPLFIYGESGLGKTHLLYAIAHTVRENHPDFRIVYIKGDDFTNEMVQALREGKNMEFRGKYRQADLFLVDDIQFIAGKDSTQEEFFHTFNTLYEAKKQIVLTSDRPPKDMRGLEERLRSRFEWGLIADIQPPDYETRLAIIKNKSVQLGLDLPDAVLEYIAENITANVRQLEGAVQKLLALQSLMGDNISVASVFKVVTDVVRDQTALLPSASLIIEEVSKFYGVEEEAVRGQQRDRETAFARQVAMHMIRQLTNLSLDAIGKEFDGRDHTTVIYSLDRIKEQMKKDGSISEVIRDITANINARNV